MLDLVNAQRAAAGVPPLAYNYNLESFATLRAAELTVLNGHMRPDGTSHSYGENFCIGFSTPQAAMNSFMASAAHSRNILSPGYTSMAGGVLYCNGTYYWVQIFGAGGSVGVPNGMSGQVTETRTVNVTAGNAANAAAAGQHKGNTNLRVGEYTVIDVAVNNQFVSAIWSSNNPSVASVDQNGKITGISPGTAVVSANLGAAGTTTILVNVTGNAAAPAAPVITQPLPTPAAAPAAAPTEAPTAAPTAAPTEAPTAAPTTVPTVLPTAAPALSSASTSSAAPAEAPATAPSTAESGTTTASSTPSSAPSTTPSSTAAASTAPVTSFTDPTQTMEVTEEVPENTQVKIFLIVLCVTGLIGSAAILVNSIIKNHRR